MNSNIRLILGLGLGLILGTLAVLGVWQKRQKLGEPGVKTGAVRVMNDKGQVAATNGVVLPETIPGFISEAQAVTTLELDWLPKDTQFGRRVYKAKDGFELLISTVLMGTDRTSIHKPQYCLNGQGLRIDATMRDKVRIGGPQGYDLPVTRLMLTKEGRFAGLEPGSVRGMFVYWFVAKDRITADEKERTVMTVKDLVKTGTLDRWAYVAVFTLFPAGMEAKAWDRAREFISEAVPQFQLVSTDKAAANVGMAKLKP